MDSYLQLLENNESQTYKSSTQHGGYFISSAGFPALYECEKYIGNTKKKREINPTKEIISIHDILKKKREKSVVPFFTLSNEKEKKPTIIKNEEKESKKQKRISYKKKIN